MRKNFIPIFRVSQGQVLIESLVSITIVTIGLLAVLGLLSRSLAFQKDLGQRLVAIYLAAEGIEIVKNIVDTVGISNITPHEQDYSLDYKSSSLGNETLGSPLVFDDASGLYHNDDGSGGVITPFSRIVHLRVTQEGPNNDIVIGVHSKVQWATRGEDIASTTIEDYFYDWRPSS